MYKVKRLLDHRNMMIAVKKGVVPRNEFRLALKEQRHLNAKTKSFKSLTEILVDRGVLTESQLEGVLLPILRNESSQEIPSQTSPDNFQVKNAACPLPEDESDSKETPDNKSTKNCLTGPSQKSLVLIMTKDGLAAYICADGSTLNPPTLKDVHRLLANRNIGFGIIDDREIEKRLEEALKENTSFQIAAGHPPEPGEPDQITYHFNTDPFRVGTVTEDGLMDWKDRGEYPHVEKDTLLATLTPGKKSVPGKDIFGNVLVADEVPRLHLFAGKGAGKSKDRLQLIAKVDGQPQLTGRGNVSVIQTLDVKSDIGVETGHVDFEGHVEVHGAVEKGYRVKADSLRAKEILSDQVEILGDVVAVRGIFGAKIRCQGRVKANHINKTTIMAEGDVAVAKEIVECTIITNGKCIIDGGTILSSEIYAKKGLKAKDVGSEASHPNKLIVGIDQIAKIKVAEFKDLINQNKNKIETLEKEIAALNQESDRLNTELGQIAQVQDEYMVNQRKIMNVLEKEQRDLTVQEQAAISALSVKMEEIDKDVGALMAKDEEIQARVVSLRNQTVELDNNINVLNEEIKQIELFATRDMGIPIVQILGKLYQGTEIVGPHDALVIEKKLYNTFLKEQKNSDKEAEKPYSFKISHR